MFGIFFYHFFKLIFGAKIQIIFEIFFFIFFNADFWRKNSNYVLIFAPIKSSKKNRQLKIENCNVNHKNIWWKWCQFCQLSVNNHRIVTSFEFSALQPIFSIIPGPVFVSLENLCCLQKNTYKIGLNLQTHPFCFLVLLGCFGDAMIL